MHLMMSMEELLLIKEDYLLIQMRLLISFMPLFLIGGRW